MKKLLSILMVAVFLCASVACSETIAADEPAQSAWYELSGDGTILTVRLPGNSKDGMD